MLNIQSVFEMKVCYTEPKTCVKESVLLISMILKLKCFCSPVQCPVGVVLRWACPSFIRCCSRAIQFHPLRAEFKDGYLDNTILCFMGCQFWWELVCFIHFFLCVLCTYTHITTNISGAFNQPYKSYCIIFNTHISKANFLNDKLCW